MTARDRPSNGRDARSRAGPDDVARSSLRRRSPLAYWAALVVLIGMVATLLSGVVASLAR